MEESGPIQHIGRRLEAVLPQLLAEEPAIVLNGPRTVGKSTLLAALGRASGSTILDLDVPSQREAVEGDPELYAAAPSPVLVDEFQKAPVLLDAIKAELNRDLRPGRYVLTGSTRYAALPTVTQSLTGRVHVVDVWPLTQGELSGVREDFVETLLTAPEQLVTAEPSTTTREEYEHRVLLGGMPMTLTRSTATSRARWFQQYLDLVLTRDVMDISRVRQRDTLPLLLRHLAAQSGSLLNIQRITDQLGTDKQTTADYVGLLEAVFLVQRLPAWGRTLGAKVGTKPKLHVVDSGLAAYLLGLNKRSLAVRDPAVMTEFGHVLESFVVNEVIRQAGWREEPTGCGHYRTHNQVEVDLVVESYDRRTAAIEVKASGRVGEADLRGLREIRDKLGDRFTSGVVLYTGSHSWTAEDRIHVLPIDQLWTAHRP